PLRVVNEINIVHVRDWPYPIRFAFAPLTIVLFLSPQDAVEFLLRRRLDQKYTFLEAPNLIPTHMRKDSFDAIPTSPAPLAGAILGGVIERISFALFTSRCHRG